MKKKLLILGAGNAQLDLIRYAKEKGLEVHGVSYRDTDPGIPLLDYFAPIDILDVEGVAAYVREKGIDCIYSIGSDIAVPTISQVAEELGLPHFVSRKTADICCNKGRMREAMGDSGYNVPYIACSTLEEAGRVSGYPMMLKPVDSQGQRGVRRVDSFAELAAHFESAKAHSRTGQVILERFLDGCEVSVNAYVVAGEVLFSLISDRESFQEYPGGIIKAHHLPSRYAGTPVGDSVQALVRETVKRLEIQNGPVYFQIKIENGQPYLIEVTPRLDGCHMWRLIKAYCAVDLLDLTMCHLLGEDLPKIPYRPSGTPFHTEFFCEPPGTSFAPEKYESCHGQFRYLYYGKGDIVRPMNGYAEKCGYRMFPSPSRVALIGGSGRIGRCLGKLLGDRLDVVEVSRTAGTVTEYTREQLLSALTGCDSAVILAAKKVSPLEPQSLGLYGENVSIVENALMACKTLGIRNIVYLSSRCVYSHQQPVPVGEDGIIAPVNYYGISKYAGELLCDFYNRRFGTHIKILRLSQVIGAGGYLVETFVKQALSGEPLRVYGRAERDYIYVKDACEAIRLALMHYDSGGIYNIGSGIGTTPRELAEAVISALGSSSGIEETSGMRGEDSAFYYATEKAEKGLGFHCQFDLRAAFSDWKEECCERK